MSNERLVPKDLLRFPPAAFEAMYGELGRLPMAGSAADKPETCAWGIFMAYVKNNYPGVEEAVGDSAFFLAFDHAFKGHDEWRTYSNGSSASDELREHGFAVGHHMRKCVGVDE
jgi:hypothetical protein